MTTHQLRVGLYARVSGEQQAKDGTIASQLEMVTQRIASDGFECDPELRFVDDGWTGRILVRPGLERLRDQAAAGAIDRLYVLDPDRFSRKYAYQVLILEELTRHGVEVVFLCNPLGGTPAENLLIQVQGIIAEYEEAKILERAAEASGTPRVRVWSMCSAARPTDTGTSASTREMAKRAIRSWRDEARVVRTIFTWVGQDRCSIGEVCRRLKSQGVPTRTGKAAWDRSVVWSILKNPAYKGTAAFGKTRSGSFKPQTLRPQRGRPQHSQEDRSLGSKRHQMIISSSTVPAIVDTSPFRRGPVPTRGEPATSARPCPGGRYLLQGLIVCKRCGYGCYGKPASRASAKGRIPYAYYRCTGSDAYRFGGERLCWNKQVRTDLLDAAVWEDVRNLLSEPERIRVEYKRRRQKPKPNGGREVNQVTKLINQVKRSISRLIDAYEEGLLEKSEFEPRISTARQRLSRLKEERVKKADEESQESELRLLIGQLEEFARQVSEGLREPDWATQRKIIRAMVKQVEIDEGEVRIVYRVSPSPFEGGPQQDGLQHCWGRDLAPVGEYLSALVREETRTPRRPRDVGQLQACAVR